MAVKFPDSAALNHFWLVHAWLKILRQDGLKSRIKAYSFSTLKIARNSIIVNTANARSTWQFEKHRTKKPLKTTFTSSTRIWSIIQADVVLNYMAFLYFFVAARPEFSLDAHDSTIHSLQKSPFLKDIMLTVGGWTFSIWKDGVTVRLHLHEANNCPAILTKPI